MLFPISHTALSPLGLVFIGVLVGAFGGLFGVGGSFIAGPLLFALGLPMRFVVGSDLAGLVGTGLVAAKRHRALGNVDVKLALLMTGGTVAGVEIGARLVQRLVRRRMANRLLAPVSAAIFIGVSLFVGIESAVAIARRRRGGSSEPPALALGLRLLRLRPLVSLPVSGIAEVSVWLLLAVGFATGILSGLLGGGGGYLRMPLLVYLLGVPTHVAVGTDLFEVVMSASYGTLSHALKGDVDVIVALALDLGAVLGARFGTWLVRFIRGPWLRLAFAPLPAVGGAILLYALFHRGGSP